MARNHIIAAKIANDIDRRVERVLRGLGYPEPPLSLEDVRELLQLDREFYTADNPSVAKEVISPDACCRRPSVQEADATH